MPSKLPAMRASKGIASIGAEVRARPAAAATEPHRIPPINLRRSIAFMGCLHFFQVFTALSSATQAAGYWTSLALSRVYS